MFRTLGLGLGALSAVVAAIAFASPASGGVIFSICSSGCDTATGTFSGFASLPGTANLVFSGPITFTGSAVNPDSNGIYTDTSTGTVFSAFYPGGLDAQASVFGTSYLQGNFGSGSGFQITLPANTYAFAMQLSAFNTFAFGLNVGGYPIDIPPGGSPVFFGVLSDTALPTTFTINAMLGDGRIMINSFEEGATPEPSTLVLMGTGLIVGSLILRRRQRTKPRRRHPS